MPECFCKRFRGFYCPLFYTLMYKRNVNHTLYTFVTQQLLIHHFYSSNTNRNYLNLLPLLLLKRQNISVFYFSQILSFLCNRSENIHLNHNNICSFDCLADMKNIRAGGCYGYCCDWVIKTNYEHSNV